MAGPSPATERCYTCPVSPTCSAKGCWPVSPQTSCSAAPSAGYPRPLGLPPLLHSFSIWTTVLTVCSWLVAILVWASGRTEQGGMWAHYDDRFADLTHYDRVFRSLHQAAFFTGAERFAYPAPAAVLYDLLLHLGHLRLAAFLIFTLLLGIFPALLFGRALLRRGLAIVPTLVFIAVLLLTSWPLLFLLERGNIESIVILFTFAGAVAFWRRRPLSAGVLWGLAACLKIYPLVLLLLFCTRRLRTAALLGLATFTTALILSFWFVGPTIEIAALGTLHGIGGFVSTYAMKTRGDELRFDHSYLAFFKAPLAIRHLHVNPDVRWLSRTYLLLFGAGAIAVYLLRARHLPRTNQFLLLSIAMVSLPPVSYDYTLLHLYPGFVLLTFLAVDASRHGSTPAVLRHLFWCFTLLFASENFVYWLGLRLNGPIKATALFVATILLLRNTLPDPLPTPRADQVPSA